MEPFFFRDQIPPADVYGYGLNTPTPLAMMHDTSLRILVVDSDDTSARDACALLEGGGHVTHTAANCTEAVSRLNSIYFDLVLMGVEPPCTDGLETARAIRRTRDVIAAIPIIAFGSTSSPGLGNRCIKAGMDAFLATPFSLPDFAETLRRVHNARVFSPRLRPA